MTQPADFTDFLAEIFQGGRWRFDSETIGGLYEDGDFTMREDELADLKELGKFIQEQADQRGIDLTQYALVRDSLTASGDNVLTPEILGSIAYGIYLSQNITVDIDENGQVKNNPDGQPLFIAVGAERITFAGLGGANEVAAEGIIKAIIEDTENPDNIKNPEHRGAMFTANIMRGW